MVAALLPQETRHVHVLQINGGLGEPTAGEHATELCRRMAVALGAKLTLLPAPGVMRSRQAKEALLSDGHVQAALSLLPRITVACVGIGTSGAKNAALLAAQILSLKHSEIKKAFLEYKKNQNTDNKGK